MEQRIEPLFDHTPWGKDEKWERDYVARLVERWQEGVSESMFLLEATMIPPDSAILDLGCGIGRHALTFARAGCEVTGIDISSHAIKRAQELCRSRNLRCMLREGDFREMAFKEEFDMVMMLDSTFGILAEDENRALLARSLMALKSGGFLIVESHNREYIVERMGRQKGLVRTWQEKEGMLSSAMASFDLQRSRYNRWSEYMILKTGEKVREPVSSIRLYTLCELALLCAEHGAQVKALYGGYDGSDYMIASEKMVFIAEKN